jgi:hypothetical protein
MRPRGAPGTVALVVGVSTEGAEQEIERSVHVDRLSATVPLADAQRLLGVELKRAGFADARIIGTGEAKVGSRASVDLKLHEGCERIDVIAGSPLGPVDAALWETKGSLIAEAKGGGRATLFACGSARDAEIDVEAATIPGPFAVEVRSLVDAPRALLAHPLAASRALERLYGAEAALPVGLEKAHAIQLSPDVRVSEPLELAPNTCLELVTALGADGSGLELAIEGADAGTVSRGRFVVGDRVCAGGSVIKPIAQIRLSAGSGEAIVLTREFAP